MPEKPLRVFSGLLVGQTEGHRGGEARKNASRTFLAIVVVDLLYVLNTDQEFDAHASTEVYRVVDVLQIWEKAKFISNETYVTLASLASEGRFYGYIEH